MCGVRLQTTPHYPITNGRDAFRSLTSQD